MRHVFDRDDLGDHALVSVASGHFVAWLQATLDRDINFDHLQDACGQLVPLREFAFFLLERRIEVVPRCGQTVFDALELTRGVIIGQTKVEPVITTDRRKVLLVKLGAFGELLWTAACNLACQQTFETFKCVVFDNARSFL
jgi:hypothetical protein